MPGKELSDSCVDCRDAEAILTLRRRRLCKDCYIKFVSYKVFKRMENYRLNKGFAKDKPCKLLFPLSYGLSSSVLLHMLHAQLEVQRSKIHGAPGFDLHVLIIEPSTISPSSPAHDEGFELAQESFPLCSFTKVPFHSIFDLVPDFNETMSQFAGKGFEDDPSLPNAERLSAFRSCITTATSKADVDYILMNRLIMAFAKQLDCQAVIWGDSDSRLAAKTLANVAKGRGSSVIWQVSDGMSPFGLEFNFPLRDLFTAELRDYASFFPELTKIILPDEPLPENTLTKNLSIDELMMRYVLTQGEKYPGVMLNVTRTANKLDASQMPANLSHCTLCSAPLMNEVAGGHTGFCYACSRSRPSTSS
ncbi:cytoplasmic tRNA 2-thiolation protein 2 [Aspergillus bertholletiae]|uniref:Cytoplasmic tRNA 2-thiolation protein 2 n=1 Tax=Aspergillus bertholletiae TaxID=1226010 RepID=A0A5N7AW54_9EURO|nr:cytoplasmic tRNA 2-thiolation protein 2 [Aspergillus bertholletiae]